ncbi:MAG: response regulator [Leeuwenhoekiella sp.]|nr:MAG: response regulator [Leeuwenhoekiella sp.]
MTPKVLLVEDSETTNFINKLVLNSAGILDINEVLNGLDAYNYILRNCPDVILLDIDMPVMDGWEFLKEKEMKALCMHAKVVMLTSSTHPKDKKMAENHPSIVAYLEKPLTLEKVKEVTKFIS